MKQDFLGRMSHAMFITNSFKETQKLAEKFAKELKRDEVLALFGNLGSGKTTFVQGLAKGLGIAERIISPTFIIVRTYEFKIQNSKVKITNQNSKLFYHVDLYRVETETDIKNLGIEEILKDKNNIIAIEWAEKIKNLLPKKRIDIYFEYVSENERKIIIKKYG